MDGAPDPWQWHLSTGRDADAAHTADDSFYFGTGEGPTGGGQYRANVSGKLTSPTIDLSNVAGTVVVEFNSFLQIEAFDTAQVSILSRATADSSWAETVLTDSHAANGLPLSTNGFQKVSLDVSAFAGKQVQVRFTFRSDEDEVVNRTESVSTQVTEGATYYIRVAGFEGSTHPLYDLTIDSPGILPDRFEPNDSFATATDLGALAYRAESGLTVHTSGNDNYYRVDVPGDGKVYAHLLFENGRGDLDLLLYDTQHNELAASLSRTDNESLTYENPDPSSKTLYLRVQGYDGATNPNYTLVVYPGITGDVLEPNDDFATARDLGTLADFRQTRLTFDDAGDYYRFTAAQSGLVGVHLVFRPTGDTNPHYELIIDGPVIGRDGFEPNDGFSTAAELGSLGYRELTGLTLHQEGDADYYRFVARQTGTLKVDLLFNQIAGDADVFLYDSSYTLLASSQKEGWYVDDVKI